MKVETTRIIGGKERKCFVDSGSWAVYNAYKTSGKKLEKAVNRTKTTKCMQNKKSDN